MPHRVLIFHPALAPYRIDLFNALARRYSVRFVFLNRNVPYQSYDQAALQESLHAECRFMDAGFSIAGRQIRFGVTSEMASFRPDVVVTHEFSPLTMAVGAKRMTGLPIPHVVWTADNPHVISTEHVLRKVSRRLVLPHIDGLIVYGQETAALYRGRFRVTQPIGLCPNAQSEDSLRSKLEECLPETRTLAEKHGLAGRKVVLYVGRLATVKRLDRLIDAFAAIRQAHQGSMLVIVGDGPERAALRDRVARLKLESDTIFAGHLEGRALYAWFNCGSVFVLPSEFEPWGAVVNEALLAGIPVVCSDHVGAKELIASDRNGEVVEGSDPAQLEWALSGWLRRVPAIDSLGVGKPRASRMMQHFRDAVNGFCGVLDAVTHGASERVRQ